MCEHSSRSRNLVKNISYIIQHNMKIYEDIATYISTSKKTLPTWKELQLVCLRSPVRYQIYLLNV
jgi:hypothetical protein